MVVLGGGFGWLECMRALQDPVFSITLVDRQNHHLFQPLLYQVMQHFLTDLPAFTRPPPKNAAKAAATFFFSPSPRSLPPQPPLSPLYSPA